ncbi:MAG: hypothetical protein C0524_13135 [Rhodobacter sp.]|nr:hypothetical protein [Rhodobacter sp.]
MEQFGSDHELATIRLAAMFFSVTGGPVEPFSVGFGPFQRHEHADGAQSGRIAARMTRTMGPVTATLGSRMA